MKYITSLSFLAISILIFSACTEEVSQSQVDNTFQEILNENTLDQWEGNPELWRFEDGVLIGETTPENIIVEHSFFIWKGDLTGDFELTLEYKISERGNSGINYRSEIVEGEEFVIRGYQADIDGNNQYTGQLYEEKGRAFLARRGQFTIIDSDNRVHETGSLGSEEDLLSQIENDGWNSYKIIAKGNTLIHIINDRIMSGATDHGTGMKKEGFLGFQLHLGPPMKVEFRNILYRKR